ncbi:N-6 DNA methylase, partial [Chroococcidiopsidales cyanobacterium LEGE 13417]|nr:N-6 DNA methylase [Chroococcidiopsidales cyanobacterium LEGE 13417]
MTGTLENRVEELRKILGYPVKELDRTSSLFWYLRPGESAESAAETCPVAVGFYSELNDELRSQIYGHYSNRQAEQQPVMYLLLPSKEGTSRVPLVLPREGGLRQKDIKTFEWNEPELQRRISLLQKDNLPIAHKAICSVPSVKWVFYEPVKTASELAKSLAEAAHKIEQAIHTVYKYEERIHPNKGENGYLHKLLKSFQLQLLRSLELNPIDENDYSFPDMYAQTITYGLFTARVFSYVRDKKAPFNQESAWQQIPKTNPFLRHLFQDLLARSREEFKELGDELIEAITEVRSILCTAEMDAILWDFQQKMYQEDIVIRFYEDFLAAYKSTMRECRGVYYTPEPIVSYIVRSVDRILQTDFELPDGLADATKVEVKKQDGISETHKVLITDIATGTGGFLYSVIDHIHRSLKPSQEVWSRYVSQNLLPRLLGFELLMAPYAIAHMKLGLQLAALGYKFDTEERLRVYLTNTLQEAFQIPPADGYDNWIRDEADAANKIKQEAPVMVVLGNPPYSGHSANNGAWISNLLKGKDIISQQATQSYFEVDGKPLGERNPKWLNDDYV